MGISSFFRERRRLLLLFLRQIGREDWAQWLENLGKPNNDQPGFRIDIGGHRLHILDLGEEDAPAVVFEADCGGWSADWIEIQEETARFARAISYDRAGHGWSEPAQRPRTLPNMAEEVNALLHNSSIRPPFVLVGRGLGGLLVQYYARFYPEKTAGVVLVGAWTLEEAARGTAEKKLPRTHDRIRIKQSRSLAYRSAVKDQNRRLRATGADGLAKEMERAGPFPSVPVIELRADASDQEILASIQQILSPP